MDTYVYREQKVRPGYFVVGKIIPKDPDRLVAFAWTDNEDNAKTMCDALNRMDEVR